MHQVFCASLPSRRLSVVVFVVRMPPLHMIPSRTVGTSVEYQAESVEGGGLEELASVHAQASPSSMCSAKGRDDSG